LKFHILTDFHYKVALLQINYVGGVFNDFENSLNLILMSMLMRDVLIKIKLIFINVCGLLLSPLVSRYLYCSVYAFCNTDTNDADACTNNQFLFT